MCKYDTPDEKKVEKARESRKKYGIYIHSYLNLTMMIPPSSNISSTAPKRGAFILLEGVDRCGKTTQVSLLVKHLLSLSLATVAYRFPDRTTQGE